MLQKFRLLEEPSFEFIAVNTHLDHISRKARIEGVKVIIEQSKKMAQNSTIPVFLMGDFNTIYGQHAHKTLVEEGGFIDSLDRVLERKYQNGMHLGNIGCDATDWVS